jgi:sugar phosphate permease
MSQSVSTAQPEVSLFMRVIVLAWLCLAATIAYISRNSIGVAESTIRAELGLSEKTMGLIMAIFFLVYALAQLPTGWIANRLGNRRALSLFMVGSSIAAGLMSFVYVTPLLIFSRLSAGVFQAGLFPATTDTISKWYGDYWRGIASGALGAFMSVGGAVGAFATGLLMEQYGWRGTFLFYSSLGLFWTISFYPWFRNTPREFINARQNFGTATGDERLPGSLPNLAADDLVSGEEPDDRAAGAGIVSKTKPQVRADAVPDGTPWLAIFSSPATWFICGQQFCRAAGQIFFSSWFATYLQETRGVSISTAGILNSMPLIALVLGSLLGGFVSDGILALTQSRILARSGLAAFCMLSCALLVFFASATQEPLLAVLLISIGTFFAAVGGPCAYTITMDMGGPHVATLFGTMNMIGNLGAFAFIYGVPWFLAQTGDWNSVLTLFGSLYVAAAIFWLVLRPQGTILDQSWIPATRPAESS